MSIKYTNYKDLGAKLSHRVSKSQRIPVVKSKQMGTGGIRRLARNIARQEAISASCSEVISCITALPGFAPLTSLNVDIGGNVVWGPDNDSQTLSIDCTTGILSISGGNAEDITCLVTQTTRYEEVFVGQTTITVTHNLGDHPFVFIVEQGTNQYISGEITYINPNTIQVDFSSPTSGLIVCRL